MLPMLRETKSVCVLSCQYRKAAAVKPGPVMTKISKMTQRNL